MTACSKDNSNSNLTIEQNVKNQSSELNKGSTNLFSEIINNNLLFIDKFSLAIADINLIQEIKITNSTQNTIDFTVTSGKLFLNGNSTNLNNRNFEISKSAGEYTLTDSSQAFRMIVDIKNGEYFVSYNQNTVLLESLIGQNIDATMERNIPVLLYLIDEFSKVGLDRKYTATVVSGREYQGTGVGFHTTLADAEQFCQEDADAIIAEHDDWYTPGVSYSCAFGENLCVCTANFYTD